jgi:polysaccharide biosynthesis/export protein
MGTKFLSIALLASLFFVFSCTPVKNITYFQQNGRDTSFRSNLGVVEAPIQRNDILNITVSSLNKTASADFNLSEGAKGYLVNNDGTIQMPTLGSVTAAGLTKKQLKDYITNIISSKELLKDPIVDIRYINFEVTVLGEVSHPTVINVPSEQISLVKALGLAGDLTIYGKRENVLLIREEDGKRITKRLNLSSVDFLSSPYYYLKPNDVIYVEPSKAKLVALDRTQQIIPVVFSAISILVLVLDRVIK